MGKAGWGGGASAHAPDTRPAERERDGTGSHHLMRHGWRSARARSSQLGRGVRRRRGPVHSLLAAQRGRHTGPRHQVRGTTEARLEALLEALCQREGQQRVWRVNTHQGNGRSRVSARTPRVCRVLLGAKLWSSRRGCCAAKQATAGADWQSDRSGGRGRFQMSTGRIFSGQLRSRT